MYQTNRLENYQTNLLEMPAQETGGETKAENKLRRTAVCRANAKIGFSIHLAAYVFAIAAQAIINLAFTPQFLWFLFPALAWGIGVATHGAIVFAWLNSDLKKRLIETEMRRLRDASVDAPLDAPNRDYVPMAWKDA